MEKHFVTFFSPGTFVAETSTREIDSWDVEAARTMAAEITERYNATPYGFQFSTRSRGPDDLDSKVSAKSPMYYINCRVETLEFLEAMNKPETEILRSNMRCNGWDRVVTTIKGWKWTQPLEANDIVLG